MVQHKQYKKDMRYGTVNVCQDNFVKNKRVGERGRGREGERERQRERRKLTNWVWFRHDEEGNASEKYYELFHGRENNYFCQ
jgi:hypothetical protein